MRNEKEVIIDWYNPNDVGIAFKVRKKIIEKRTKYQKIEIYETTKYGKILLIDGLIQSVEKGEESYHEVLVHPALFAHPSPEQVLIIGGGEGATLREVLKHPVKKAIMVDIDGEMVEIAKKYLKFDRGAFNDKRAEILIEDGFKFLRRYKERYDVIIVDATDPGEKCSNPLYTTDFLSLCFDSLNKNGIYVTQGGTSVFLNQRRINNLFKELKKVFKEVKLYKAPVFGLFPDWIFWVGIKGKIEIEKKPAKNLKIPLSYYSPAMHTSLFSLPPVIQKILY